MSHYLSLHTTHTGPGFGRPEVFVERFLQKATSNTCKLEAARSSCSAGHVTGRRCMWKSRWLGMGGTGESNSPVTATGRNDSRKSIHVFERDCSVQLRKQKAELLITVCECSRSSRLHPREAILCVLFLSIRGMNPELRQRITSAAVALCESARLSVK